MGFNFSSVLGLNAKVTGQNNVDALTQSVKNVEGATKGLAGGLRSTTNLLKGLAAAYAVREGALFIKGIIDTADSLRDLSAKTGVGVSALSALKTAGELNGLAFDQLQVGLKKFNVNLVEASLDGASKASGAFKAIGVAVKDSSGNLKPSSQLLFEIADRFKNLQDGPYKAAIAVKLFGKSGADLIPVLNEGAAGIRKYGLAISDDFANRADQFNDSLTLLGVQVKNLAINGLGGALLPTLQEVANAFSTFLTKGGDYTGVFDAIAEAVRLLAVALNTTIHAFIDVGTSLIDLGGTATDYVKTTYAQVKALASGHFAEMSKLRDDFVEREKKKDAEIAATRIARAKNENEINKSLLKNSLIFGDGTKDQIKARSAAETAAKPRVKGLGGIDPNALDTKASAEQEAGIKAVQKRIIAINAETKALGQSDLEKKKTLELAFLEEHGLKKNTAAYDEYSKKILDAVDAQEKHRRELEANPLEGAKRALRDYIDAAKDLATQTQGVVSLSLKGLEDQFVEFFTKGTFQWKQFANTIIAEIVRIAVKRAIIAPLAGAAASAFGFADGGIMTSRGPLDLKKYASGGIANSPQLALFGEGRKPEAFVPLPDGRRIPVAMQGESGGGNVAVSVTVNMANGSEQSSASDQQGQNLGKVVSAAVVAEIIKQKRPGGLL